MGEIFRFHGLTVGVILNTMDSSQRQQQYACDITYGTNNEFGFDYLRDNMSVDKSQQVQRKHNYAIVDEVDSVLIDEARTPLIISGPVDRDDQQFNDMKPKVEKLIQTSKKSCCKYWFNKPKNCLKVIIEMIPKQVYYFLEPAWFP